MARVRAAAGALAIAALPGSAPSDGTAVDGFRAARFTASNGVKMPYRLFVPDSARDGQPYPLILYLHGRAGLGTDNLKQISQGNRPGTHLWTRTDLQEAYPAIVLAPQVCGDARWSNRESGELSPSATAALELIDTLSARFPVDTERVYLIGQSMGGHGVWDIIVKRPEIFAAAVPVCGTGSPDLGIPRRTRSERACGAHARNGGRVACGWKSGSVHGICRGRARHLGESVCGTGAARVAFFAKTPCALRRERNSRTRSQ